MRSIIVVALAALALSASARTFDKAEWNVRCWDSEKRIWTDRGVGKMTITHGKGSTKIANTTGIHRHAHLVFPVELKGDFTFTIELKGGYELGWLNRAGKDEMLYVELGEAKKFEIFELSRTGTRFTIKKNGRVLPMVHFRFDYGEDALITLAIKDGDSAEIKSYELKQQDS